MKLSDLIKKLTAYLEKYGDISVSFFSYEWATDLEDKEYQERWLLQMRKVGKALRIYLDG